jgi:hypothetical protein
MDPLPKKLNTSEATTEQLRQLGWGVLVGVKRINRDTVPRFTVKSVGGRKEHGSVLGQDPHCFVQEPVRLAQMLQCLEAHDYIDGPVRDWQVLRVRALDPEPGDEVALSMCDRLCGCVDPQNGTSSRGHEHGASPAVAAGNV